MTVIGTGYRAQTTRWPWRSWATRRGRGRGPRQIDKLAAGEVPFHDEVRQSC
ncbi:hypothetical protein QJS66_03335 [Kocuria rhizophila]|nr:hypothetical protein QJS66_03335 [Kocuria rhizophila]